MKKLITFLTLASTLLLSACLTMTPSDPKLVVEGTLALDEKGVVELIGSGFAPNTPITLLFTTADGVESDIGYAVEPAPIADANGDWQTTWSYGRFVKKKLVAAGDFTLLATDADFNPLAIGIVSFK